MEQAIIICGPGPGYTSGREVCCDGCGRDVWLSDSSVRRVLKDHTEFKVYCIPCGMAIDDVQIIPPNEEQIREIEQALKRE